MQIKSIGIAGLVLTLSVTAGWAAPVTAKQAKKLLFKGTKFTVQMVEDAPVSPETMVGIDLIVGLLSSPQGARALASSGLSLEYYGAIAVMPDQVVTIDNIDKILSFSGKLHSPEAAAAAAKAGCDALGGPECVVVALVVPKRYKPVELTLSMAATNTFRASWKEGQGPKFLAYSPTSGAWTIGKGAGADVVAIERCNAAEGSAGDCMIAITEE